MAVSERMRSLLETARDSGARVHVSGTSAAVFANCVVERVEGERVWLQPENYPGGYTPRLAELVLVAVVGGECITRARGRTQVSAKSLGAALEGVRKLSTATLTPEERRGVEEALRLLSELRPGVAKAEEGPGSRHGRRKASADDAAPMLPLG